VQSTEIPGSLARYGHEIVIREGRAFYLQDDSATEAFYLLAGSVRPVKFAPDGKPFDLPELTAPCWLALAELVGEYAYLFDAVALTECRALSFGRKNLALALADRDAASFVMDSLACEVARIHRVVASSDARGKILAYLCRHRGTLAGFERSRLMLTQAAIADAVGLTRETVNRQLKELESLELVTLARGEIGIPDWDALDSYASSRGIRSP